MNDAMNAFLVSINATGCLVAFNGELHRMGFFTSREVLAHNADEAEVLALAALHELPELLQKVRNPEEDPMRLTVESTVEVAAADPSMTPAALSWYAEDDDEQL